MSRNVPKLRFNGFDGELKSFKFKQLVKLQRGSSPRPIVKYITDSDDGVNWIKIGDVSKGETIINSTKEKITKEGALKSRFVQVGDLILSNSMSYGRPYIMGIDGYIHDGWFVLRDYENNFKRDYLCQLLTSSVIQKQYKKLAAGGVVDNISSELVNSVSIKLPSLQEQEKIVNFLSKVDSIIEKQEKKVQYWNSYKKGMMQKIFSQKIRFKDENGRDYPEWEERALKKIIKEDLYPVNKPSVAYEKLSVRSHAKGTFSSRVDDPETVAMDTLYEVKENQLIVNITFAWEHAIAIVKKEDEGKLVSHRFPTYKFNSDCYYKFYEYVIKQSSIKYKLGLASPGGAGRNRVLNKKEFLKIEVQHPCFGEQVKIANFLSNIDNIIEKENQKLEELKQWKKGLLQQMFV
ncbi:EcoKI restriction-modification system protein HsdS [Clostridium perfringens]|uniref:restriction endonuclease subunit S n=1 Tax=Clostridium perfringens TaxID=1502 RepID=UPI001CAB6266|nr:restriction endonuclease subunit S [Clostridium perfringens]MDG6887172.1 EcoKI restriction-modification system protein HsdS [Clostridium perfringens]HBI7028224.1 restriction endonuclease subunit S [Clostridium perfringens]HBI7035838.1 restriction endonuclease subunit S [Clostridium perfringens]HBI7050109.1 restriction endonuclease subunit S [Clostridium perfringens]